MNELYHYGIKDMKWGVRRFQDYAGKLTEAGRERYGVGLSKAKSAISTAKKAGSFGVALGKAKGEHYKKAASRGVYEVSKRARKVSSSIGRALNTQKSVANRLRNVGNQMAYSKKRSVTLKNLTSQAEYKKRYDAGKTYIDSLLAARRFSSNASYDRMQQRSKSGEDFVRALATTERILLSSPSNRNRTTLSGKGKLIAARRTVDYFDNEYSSTYKDWQDNITRYRKRSQNAWKQARGL